MRLRAVISAGLAVMLGIGTTVGGSACSGPSARPTAAPSTAPTGPTTTAPTATPVLSATATPSPVPPAVVGKDAEQLPTSRPVVALTFDAGANADGLPSILATLARERVPATFFLTGDFARQYPGSVASIVAAGYRLGNHSMTHPAFTSLSDAEITAQVRDADDAIRAAGGTDPRPLFRFPFGNRNARTIAAVNAAGYGAVRWTVDSLGWQGTTGGITAAIVAGRVLASARPGQIVLMHVGSHPTDRSTLDADALPTVIAQLRERGYGFTTLDPLWSTHNG